MHSFIREIDGRVTELRLTILNTMQIVSIERDGTDGILVTFSDGTIAGYVAEELIDLRLVRERVKPAADVLPIKSRLKR